jgi:hypothetical protein
MQPLGRWEGGWWGVCLDLDKRVRAGASALPAIFQTFERGADHFLDAVKSGAPEVAHGVEAEIHMDTKMGETGIVDQDAQQGDE